MPMTGFLGSALSSIITPIRGWSEARALREQARGSFDTQHLGEIDGERLRALLASGTAAEAFETDGPRIAAALADGEISGGVNKGDRRALHALAVGLAPRRVLEIGTHVGASTAHLALPLSCRDGAKLLTVDIADVNRPDGPWRKAGLQRSPRQVLEALGCAGVIEFVVGDSLEVLSQLQGGYDLIFLDGRHSSNQVYREMQVALRLLAPGGSVLLHDYYPGGRPLFGKAPPVLGPYLAMDRIMRECGSLAVRPLGDLPWPTKLGSHATSLALVTRASDTVPVS